MANIGIDEEDLFESDFASTDEEDANRDDLVTGEAAVDDEEKLARKVCNITNFIRHIGLTIPLGSEGTSGETDCSCP